MASCYSSGCENTIAGKCSECHSSFCKKHGQVFEMLCNECFDRKEPDERKEIKEARARRLKNRQNERR